MAIYELKGSLLDADLDYYCHQVNCQGRMASGIAKAIRDKWPVVYEKYAEMHKYYLTTGGVTYLHGKSQIVPVNDKQNVINMFAQLFYGYDGKRYTSYDAFWMCLNEIKEQVPKGSKIGFPAKIGCGLGGADWTVIFAMIYAALVDDYEVYIYQLEG